MRRFGVASATLLVALFLSGAATAGAQNVSQVLVTVDSPTFSCPTGGQTALISGLELSLETSGRPVLVMYNIQFAASPSGIISLVPVIDGAPDVGGQLDRAIGDFPFSGQVDAVHFSRVYSLPEGVHSFAVRANCQSAVNVSRRWLIAYELPRDKRGPAQEKE